MKNYSSHAQIINGESKSPFVKEAEGERIAEQTSAKEVLDSLNQIGAQLDLNDLLVTANSLVAAAPNDPDVVNFNQQINAYIQTNSQQIQQLLKPLYALETKYYDILSYPH